MTTLRARWFVPFTCAVLGLVGACTLVRTTEGGDAASREILAMAGCALVAVVALVLRTRKRWPAALALIALAPMIQYDPDLMSGGVSAPALILALFGCFVSTLWIFVNEDPVEPLIATAQLR